MKKEFNSVVENVNIENDFEKSFLRYAMSVITSRALPDARDGLKPVNRRIIYGMNVLGLTHDKAFKKSARVVGEVIGKYHPHGEASIYGSLVHLSQDFSMNYPLVNGHGNFGSIDGDPPAAQRYTEAKLSKIASLLTNDLNKNTVDFKKNYDGSEVEPVVLPAYFPNLLVNGTFGIAVGMSTKIPPHNLKEISNAIIKLIENKDISNRELLKIVTGPDFPTGGEVDGDSGLKQAYVSGTGKYVLNSKFHIEDKKGVKSIIITEIPFNVKKNDIIIKIGKLSRDKEIKEIQDLKDESSHGKIRLKITLKKNVNVPIFMKNLFKKTDLQKREDINLLALVNNQPKVLTLREALNIYIEHQKEVITRKTQFELKKAQNKLHILEGQLIALNNIDEVVRIIKEADYPINAKQKLMERFNLSEIQSKSILEMQLQRLTSLETKQIQSDYNILLIKVADYKDILENKERINEIIINQQQNNIEKFGVERKTKIIEGFVMDLTDEELMNDEEVYITVSKNGYFRRIDYDTFKTQKKGGRGIKGVGLYENDFAKWMITTTLKSWVFLITSVGKIYSLKAYEIPFASKNAKGIPISHLIDKLVNENEKLTSVLSSPKNPNINSLVFVTKNGYIKRTDFSHFRKINVSGKKAITLNENDQVLNVHLTKHNDEIIIAGSNNKLVRFDINSLTSMGRIARGVKAMKLPHNAYIVSSEIVSPNDYILVIFNNAKGKRISVSSIRKVKRNSSGVQAIKNGQSLMITKILKANDNDIILLTTKDGLVISMNATEIRKLSRTASGSTTINLEKGDEIVDVVTKNEGEMLNNNESNLDNNNVSRETLNRREVNE